MDERKAKGDREARAEPGNSDKLARAYRDHIQSGRSTLDYIHIKSIFRCNNKTTIC